MRFAVLLLLAGPLLLAGVVQAAPLDIFKPLIGGQWNSVAKFPDGQEIRSRTVWTWGEGKRSVRVRRFVLGKEGEVQRYETVVYHDPKQKRIVFRVFTAAGIAGRGTVFMDGSGIVLEQKAQKNFPAMRNGYYVDKDAKRCSIHLWFKGKDGWKQRGDTKAAREKLTPAKSLPVGGDANPLAALQPLSNLPGWKWSMHKRLLTGPDDMFVSFKPKEGLILFLLIDNDGAVFEGTLEIEDGNRFVWNLTSTRRRILQIQTHETWDERKGDNGWERVHPLDGIAWLVGGQWEAKSALPGGRNVESRMVVEFGPGKWSLRMRYYVRQGDEEYQQYETLLWADPELRADQGGTGVKYVTFGLQGLVVEGSGTIKDGVMTLEQPMSANFPAMRSVFKPDPKDKDKYIGDTFLGAGGEWLAGTRATQTRKPIQARQKRRIFPDNAKLAPLHRFVGGEWSYAMAKTPETTIGYHTQEPSLHANIQIGKSVSLKGGKRVPDSLACVWYDAAKKSVRSVSISSRGTVTRSDVELSDKGSVWTSVDTIRSVPEQNVPKQKSRTEFVWEGEDAYKLRVYGENDKLTGELVGKRVKKR